MTSQTKRFPRWLHAGASALVGIGVDVVEVSEFARMPYAANRRFYERCFSAGEISYCMSRADPERHFAARFAAKEAGVKAAASLIVLVPWQVEVTRLESGQPGLRFRGEDGGDVPELAGHHAYVSLAHSESTAMAAVLLCGEGELE